MKSYTMLEIAVEVALQIGDKWGDIPRAESRWRLVNIAENIINKGFINDTSEDIDETIAGYLASVGYAYE
jgi:hypothetical protein